MAGQVNDYSALDRLVHRLAFAGPAVQMVAADIERIVFGSSYEKIPASRPIFITSLPRAGTTTILNALNRLPFVATHLYRDMPFVLAPVLWSRLSGSFRKSSQLRERAHGDGMAISVDSPEAFEEIIWHAFWSKKYSDSGIELWSAGDVNQEAAAFLQDHFRKIIALRCPDGEGRYVSKNNANIARIDLIANMWPDARIVVPVRRPLDHAASLLRQHLNFLDIHARDPFALRYMRDIGHFEFGALHRPIQFPGFDGLCAGHAPESLDYWLAYWIAAFDYVRSRHGLVTVVSYERMCARGVAAAGELCTRLEIDPAGDLERVASEFRPSRTYDDAASAADPILRSRAEELHAALSCFWADP